MFNNMEKPPGIDRFVNLIRFGAVEALFVLAFLILGIVGVGWPRAAIIVGGFNVAGAIVAFSVHRRSLSAKGVQSLITRGPTPDEPDEQYATEDPDDTMPIELRPLMVVPGPKSQQTPVRLQTDEHEDEVELSEAPPTYYHPRHWKHYVKQDIKPVFVAIVALAALVTLIYFWHVIPAEVTVAVPWAIAVLALVVVCGAFDVYRNSWWKQKHHPIECDPGNGILKIYQTGNPWLLLRGSAPDQYSIDEVELITPMQSRTETYLFHRSHTLEIKRGEGGETRVLARLEDVMDVQDLLDIQTYRQQLKFGQQNETNNLLRQLLEQSRSNKTLEQILAELQKRNQL